MCLRGSLVPNWRGLRFLSCFESSVGRPPIHISTRIEGSSLAGKKYYYSSSQNRLELPLSNKKDTIYTSLLLLDKILRIYNFFGYSRIQYCAKSLVLWFLIGVVVINCFGNLFIKLNKHILISQLYSLANLRKNKALLYGSYEKLFSWPKQLQSQCLFFKRKYL